METEEGKRNERDGEKENLKEEKRNCHIIVHLWGVSGVCGGCGVCRGGVCVGVCVCVCVGVFQTFCQRSSLSGGRCWYLLRKIKFIL